MVKIFVLIRVKRATYMRQYPTTLVQPDGSTITGVYNYFRPLGPWGVFRNQIWGGGQNLDILGVNMSVAVYSY